MSREARDWAWSREIPPTQKLVLLVLAERADKRRICWPSIRHIAEQTGLSPRCVQKTLRELERRTLISLTPGGGRCANRYHLAPHIGTECTGAARSQAHRDRPKGACRAPVPRSRVSGEANQDHPNRHRTVTEPKREPSCVSERQQGDYAKKESNENKQMKLSAMTVHFEQFWQVWPKKRSKGDAWKAWRVLKPDDGLAQQIVSAVESAKQTPDWRKEGGRYIPYPATWLRARGWEDEYEVAVDPIAPAPQGESARVRSTIESLRTLFTDDIFGASDEGRDLSESDGLPGGGVRRGDFEGKGRRLLGSTQGSSG